MRSLFLLACLLMSCTLYAQRNGTIKGTAYDTAYKTGIGSATISLLEKKDSSLVSFTMSDDRGHFEFTKVAPGDYRLLITHVNYPNTDKFITVTADANHIDLGNIIISNKGKLLDAVTVKAEAPPVTLIGDTVQYNAGSFKTPPNASVEQLLKKLPGVKVEKDGTVKAQGEKVNRVLVDGKEFFGSDPKIATKNLPADAVDKVQVYDRQSDQAQLTGFDDGNYEKTINLKLKKDKKKGLFGKLSGGYGTDKRYDVRGNVNSFKGARQISGLAMANNSNAEGFSMQDLLNFSGELQRMMRNGGGSVSMNSDPTGLANINRNNAINTTRGAGLNYNNIIGTKTDLQSNYFYNRYNPYAENVTKREYLLPDSSYDYNQNSVSDNVTENHRLNGNALYQFDSSMSLRVTPSFGYQENHNRSNNTYNTVGGSGKQANDGMSNNVSDNKGSSFKNDLFFRKRINKRGRTFSALLQTTFNSSNGSGRLFSNNSFYDQSGSLLGIQHLNQQNSNSTDLSGYSGRLVYTEPLFRRSLLEFSVSQGKTNNNAAKTTYDYNSSNGKYDLLNNALTNTYKSEYDFMQGGIRLRKQKKKYRYGIGASLQHADLDGRLLNTAKDSAIKRSFDNLLPDATFQYNFSRFKSLVFRYSTSTNKPDITQLQPVPDNSDPLNIRLGNPVLKQEYTNSIRANMTMMNPYKNKSFFFLADFQITGNKIVNSDSITASGVKYTRPVNTNGVKNFTGQLSYSFPVKFLKSDLELRSMANMYKGKQFVNGAANTIRSSSITPEISWDLYLHKDLTITLGTAYTFSNTKYSLQPALSNHYLTQEYNFSADWDMPKKFFLSTDFSYTRISGRAAGFNQNLPLWNASISKQFMKYNRGEIKFSAADLLNSNIGITRNTNQNYIEDIRSNTVKRFFMLRFTYSLSKTGLTGGRNR